MTHESLSSPLLLAKLPLGLCLVDADLQIREWNSLLEEWTGWPASRMLGESLTMCLAETRKKGIAERIHDVLKTGVPAVFSWALHRQLITIPETAPAIYRSMIQDTRVVRVSTSPPLALIIFSDVTIAAEQKDQLRTDRRALQEAQTSLQKSYLELEEQNRKLQIQIAERQQIEQDLRRQTAEFISAKVRESEHTRHLEQLVRDLTKAQQAAEVAVRTKSEFLANMSHEIRTPMTAILGYVDLLAQEQFAETERQDLIVSIQRNSQHLTEIIDDILDISKIEAGKMQVDVVAFSPREIVTDVAYLMRDRAQSKGLELKTRLMDPLPDRILSDPTRFRQILINLVGNAVKFTGQGRIQVTVQWQASSSEQGHLLIEVKDTGVGIPAEVHDQIFAPFVQADSRMSRQYGGTGLGLAISRRLARMLGGDLTFTSEVGQGTTFTFKLTCHAEMSTPPTLKDAPMAMTKTDQSTALANARILIVDDTADNRKLLSFHMKKAGATIDLAENGQDALEKVAEARTTRPYDMILMDMQMPVLDGYEATRTLREQGDATPVIAVTAHAMAGDREKCLSVGCNEYITKPISREKLLEIMQQMLQAAMAFRGQ